MFSSKSWALIANLHPVNRLMQYNSVGRLRAAKHAIIELPRVCGFYQHYNPKSGQGHGAENFSWTAALLLDVLTEEQLHDE